MSKSSRTRPRLRRPSMWVAIGVAYVTGVLMTGIDMQIVNVALPTLSRRFYAPLPEVQWTVLAYLLTLATVIPASGWIGDRVGTKRTFLFALALFTGASALCGAADSLAQLIAARALQGIGGGMMTPAGTAMLYRAYPPDQRARVTRILILPIIVGPGVAPIIGGVLTQTLSWRWVFLINVPVGLATLLFSVRYLPEHRESSEGRLDVGGMLLSGVGLSGLLYAISEGAVVGWAAPQIIFTGLGGLTMLWVFARGALRKPDPLLRLALLRKPLMGATNAVFVLTTGVFLASLYLTPVFLQQVLHQSPIDSGTTTCLEVIGVAIGSQTIGRLYPRFGPRVLTGSGALALTIYMALFVLVSPGVSLWWVRGLMFFGGASNIGVFLAIQTSMFTHISSQDTGHASAIYNAVRQSSIAVDIAVLTTVAAAAGSTLTAFHDAYLAGALMCAAGSVLAWALISTNAARETMTQPPEAETGVIGTQLS